MEQTTTKLLRRIKDRPVEIGRMLGFNLLTDIHNEWIKEMLMRGDDQTLQAHRGSYKTTCVAIALSLIIILFPNDKTLFMRKTNSDVEEVLTQVKKILKTDIMRQISSIIWGVEVELVVDRYDMLTTNLAQNDPRGTPQLLGIGTKNSLTGKHFDRIFTDDIVNVEDRTSKAERERTKIVYQELQNIKNRGGRIFNTGTPWHKDDAFAIMPNAEQYDCYSTGLIAPDVLEDIKHKMTASLFAANYELRHIASDKVIFPSKTERVDISLVEQGECHIDASYGGEDYTAFTICRKSQGKYYVLGKLWHKHVDDCEDDICKLRKELNAGRISCETNGDKGYLARDLKKRGERTHAYHERMNKYLKITSYLKAEWDNIYFCVGTDESYINQICDYTEDAEHDDAPDSLASIVRILWGKTEHTNESMRNASYLL